MDDIAPLTPAQAQDDAAAGSERPLVTFALFAYNQEQYVREAIEAAFAQTYQPLEIILSDDCSPDRTFAIMQEMAAAYAGPHKVVARRNNVNQGTLAHVLAVADEACGELIVVAAGDDISLPYRTEFMANLLFAAADDVVVASANDILFDGEKEWVQKEDFDDRRKFYENEPGWFLGATACFRRRSLVLLPKPQAKVLFEDTAILTVLSNLRKRSLRVEDILVKRRVHDDNVGHVRRIAGREFDEREREKLRVFSLVSEAYHYSHYALSEMGCRSDYLRRRAEFFSEFSKWPQISFCRRFLLVWASREQGYTRPLLARLFGRALWHFLMKLRAARE